MANVLRRVGWRPIFFIALIIVCLASPFLFRDPAKRTDMVRIALIGEWVGLALVASLLAWRSRASTDAEWRAMDIMTVVVLLGAALYESRWPGPLVNHTPESVVMVWAALGFFQSVRALRNARKQTATGAMSPDQP